MALSHTRQDIAVRKRKMWQSMRILRRFALNDIVITACVPYSVARNYVTTLIKMGVVRKIKSHTARWGDFALYVLQKTDSPKPPFQRRRRIDE